MSPVVQTSSAPAAPVDQKDPIHCPLCDYDLRGLTEPRCPECGYTFVWRELLDPTLRLHPYLFEHHPERNARAFWRTFKSSRFPRRFWSGLFPTQRVDQRRLIVYWGIVAGCCLLPFVVAWGWDIYRVDAENRMRRTSAYWSFTPTQEHLDVFYPILPNWRVYSQALIWLRGLSLVAIWIVGWPWLTFAALMIYQKSMQRAQIRPLHVLRCVIYSGDALLLPALAIIARVAYETASVRRVGYAVWSDETQLVKAVLILSAAVFSYRLWIAYRTYLRFNHALAVAAASQTMVLLLIWKIGLDLDLIGW